MPAHLVEAVKQDNEKFAAEVITYLARERIRRLRVDNGANKEDKENTQLIDADISDTVADLKTKLGAPSGKDSRLSVRAGDLPCQLTDRFHLHR